jgi:hypothetical protein
MAKRENAAAAGEPAEEEGQYWLAPGEGRLVPQEDGKPWPTEGMEDPDTLYTRRRVADGDLVKVPAPQKPEGEK